MIILLDSMAARIRDAALPALREQLVVGGREHQTNRISPTYRGDGDVIERELHKLQAAGHPVFLFSLSPFRIVFLPRCFAGEL